MVSLHSQRHFKTHLLCLLGVAELTLHVIDPIILLQFLFPCIFHLTNAEGSVCLFGPSTHVRSFQARSVNLVTLFLGKPPGQFTNI